MAFPAGPYTNGQTHTEAGVVYTYSTTIGGWVKPAASGGGASASPTVFIGSLGGSIAGVGDLTNDLVLQLKNDEVSPGGLKFYGTSNTGVKGWRTYRGTAEGSQVLIPDTRLPYVIASNSVNGNDAFTASFTTGGITVDLSGVTLPPNRTYRIRFAYAGQVNRTIFLHNKTDGVDLIGNGSDGNGFYTGTYILAPTSAKTLCIRSDVNGGNPTTLTMATIDIATID